MLFNVLSISCLRVHLLLGKICVWGAFFLLWEFFSRTATMVCFQVPTFETVVIVFSCDSFFSFMFAVWRFCEALQRTIWLNGLVERCWTLNSEVAQSVDAAHSQLLFPQCFQDHIWKSSSRCLTLGRFPSKQAYWCNLALTNNTKMYVSKLIYCLLHL